MRLDDFERQQHVVDDLAPRQQIRVLECHAGDLHRPAHPVAEDDDLAGIGGTSPVTSFINDDLPQPDGPTTAANSPRSTVRVVPFNAQNAAEAPLVGQRDIADVDEGGHDSALDQLRVRASARPPAADTGW